MTDPIVISSLKAKRAELDGELMQAEKLEHGFAETKASNTNKLARASMSAHFFLASLAAIQKDAVRLEEI